MEASSNATNNVKAEPTPKLPLSPIAAQSSLNTEQTEPAPKPPSLRFNEGTQISDNRAPSSTPLGNINVARRPGQPQNPSIRSHGSQLPQEVQARMKAFHLSRQGPPLSTPGGHPGFPDRSLPSPRLPASLNAVPQVKSPVGTPSPGINAHPHLSTADAKDSNTSIQSTPAIASPVSATATTSSAPKKGLAAKRGLKMGMKLSDASGPPSKMNEPNVGGPLSSQSQTLPVSNDTGSLFNKYSEYVDTKTGTLNFKGKAMVHGKGIDFSGGNSFNISLDEIDTLDELGKGNYGTVFKVRHSRPKIRRPGQGLVGNRALSSRDATEASQGEVNPDTDGFGKAIGNTSGVIMAMKEIRLELDEAKFAAIIMELDVLHRCISPYIIDFYGAFFQEGAVYICMEFMDGGSVDKLYSGGVPEHVLRKITLSAVLGLKSLKEDHNIIHRDVKPTNILVNTKGQVKICDFGVSGNLVASIAKTNIGCQSYMAPERISGGGVTQVSANAAGGTYSVQSDIWSLGLTIIECAMGRYPYPPETYDNIFSQLSVSSLVRFFSYGV